MTTTTTINPMTGADLATHEHHTDTDIDAIVDAAHASFNEWRRCPLQAWAHIETAVTICTTARLFERPGFYPVTVLEDVRPGIPAYDDELFGPVASIIRVADDAEAVRVANDSRF